MNRGDSQCTLLMDYSGNDVFDALCAAFANKKRFKIIKADREHKKVELEVGARLFVWGEAFVVSYVVMPDKTTEVTVQYVPRPVELFGVLVDTKAVKATIHTILSSLSDELKQYPEIVPNIKTVYKNGGDSTIKLEALRQMLDGHIITQSEFDAREKELLSRS